MSNPKERFLKLFYAALCDFEEETGVEIHSIKIDRISNFKTGVVINKTIISEYYLELK